MGFGGCRFNLNLYESVSIIPVILDQIHYLLGTDLINKLTILTMTEVPFTTPLLNADKLLEISASIPEPNDYFLGESDDSAVLPRNILLFNRRSLSDADRHDDVHHRYVLLCCLATDGCVFIDGVIHHYKSGQAVLIFPDQLHHFVIPDEEINWLFITFDLPKTRWLQPMLNQVLHICAWGKAFLYHLVENSLSNHPLKVNGLTHGLGYLLSLLAKCANHQKAQMIGSSAIQQNRSIKIMHQVNNFIYANISKSIAIDELALEVGLSASHLRRIVFEQIGIGLGLYIRRIRINFAKNKLLETDYSIKHIAYDCGFNSPQSFARAFRMTVGQSPYEYRTVCAKN